MNGIVSSSSFRLSNYFFEKAFQSRRKWPSTLRLPLVRSLDSTVGWCLFQNMIFTAAWALHPRLGFIVSGSSRQEPPWLKGHRGLLEWGFGLIQFLC
ncbi:hypothetical protein GQ457_02G012500 [Hibiscus cannabinus]